MPFGLGQGGAHDVGVAVFWERAVVLQLRDFNGDRFWGLFFLAEFEGVILKEPRMGELTVMGRA